MPSYKAPLDDMRFVLNEVLGVSGLSSIKDFEAVDDATINQFLAEVAKMAENVLFPLNASGDREGCRHDRDTRTVTTPAGFKDAYRQFCAAGLPAFACDPAYGGLGMPIVLNTAIAEMLCSANMSFGMYPGLSHGAYNALYEYGTDAQKNTYLPKLVTGEWTGTMCLTEPQCGTDLGLIRTRADAQADGSYKITGTKIFISAGEHDLSENIIHLVLARINDPSTPKGIKGISLFVVPKFLPADDGGVGARNGVSCPRIEEKMGIHANSTCEIALEDATGWLVGEAHKGMRAMFVMMNEARLGVGLQGLGLSEVSYQNGLAYALDRRQGQPIDQRAAEDAPAAHIIQHPDVRREVLTMRAETEGARMLAYWVSYQLDIAHKHPDENTRKAAKKCVDLLTPIVKAHFTDNAVDHANAAMQIFGGHGYIREHGVEQYARDARITRIYEGTNGIQALDLLGRKVFGRERLMQAYLAQARKDLSSARRAGVPHTITAPAARALRMLNTATLRLTARGLLNKLRGRNSETMLHVAASATDYLKLASHAAMAHAWVKMAETATRQLKDGAESRDFYETKLKTARFYMDKALPRIHAHVAMMKSGAGPLMAIPAENLPHQQTTVAEKSLPKLAP